MRAFVKPFLKKLAEVALGASTGALIGVVEAAELVEATNTLEVVSHGS